MRARNRGLQKGWRTALAVLLTACMVFSAIPTQVLAEAGDVPLDEEVVLPQDEGLAAVADEEAAEGIEVTLPLEGTDEAVAVGDPVADDAEGEQETPASAAESEDVVAEAPESPSQGGEAAEVSDQEQVDPKFDELVAQVRESTGLDATDEDVVRGVYERLVALVKPADVAEAQARVEPLDVEAVLAGEPATSADVANAAYELLRALELEADVLVTQDGGTSWNAVRIGEAWLHLDAFEGARQADGTEAEPWLLLTDDELLMRDSKREGWTSLHGGAEYAAEEEAAATAAAEEDAERVAESSSQTDANKKEQAKLENPVVDPNRLGLAPQASDTVYAYIYNTHELKIGTNLPTSNVYTGWDMGSNNAIRDQSNVTNRNPWRDYSSYITKITVTSNVSVVNCYEMFDSMSSVTSIDVSKLNVRNCTTFKYMFWMCSSLKTLNMSGWTITNWNTPADYMYEGCTSLQTVKVGSGFKFCTKFPEYSVNGHTNWYSATAKKWLTSGDIFLSRDNIADTYTKSGPATKRNVNNSSCKVSIATQAWTGKQLKPAPTVKWGSTTLKKGTHYKIIAYGTNKNNGKTNNWVQIQGIGSYTGKRKIAFTIKKPNVQYRTHVQTFGWQGWMKDGATSGTTGQSKRLEGINIKLGNAPVTGSISYRTHIQTYGWESGWKSNGAMSGTSGQSKRLEAIQIKLTGNMAKKYDVWYCVHAQQFGWLGWAKNGASSGTAGYSYRLEGIKIKLLPKGSSTPAKIGSTTVAFRDRNSLTYKLKRDTWNFRNYSAAIPKSYFVRCFGASKGTTLYNAHGSAQGLCYGLAASPGSIITNAYPTVSSFGKSKIYDIAKSTKSSSINMTADAFVKYCHVAQYDVSLLRQMSDTYATNGSKAADLVSAVRSHIHGGNAMVIDLLGSPLGSHSVMPLNISTDDSAKTVIDVYDPNHPTSTQRLTFYKSGGQYAQWTYSDDVGYEVIAYETPGAKVKSIMAGNGKALNTSGMQLVSTTSNITVESGGKSYRLSPDATNDPDAVVPVVVKGGGSSDGTNLYWVGFDTSNMKIKNVKKSTKVTVSADSSAVEISIKKGGIAAMSVSDEGDNSASISGDPGDTFEITYLEYVDGSSEPTRTKVKGKVKGKASVETWLTPQGDVDVSGAKDVTVK